MVVNACNSSTWEVDLGGSRAQGQPGYRARPCFNNNKISSSPSWVLFLSILVSKHY
jgi:hypothetical protein